MKFYFLFCLSILFAAFFVGCESTVEDIKVAASHIDTTLIKDGHSYSNIDKIRTKHLHLELDVNFENKTIEIV